MQTKLFAPALIASASFLGVLQGASLAQAQSLLLADNGAPSDQPEVRAGEDGPAAATVDSSKETEAMKNKRMQTLEGSKSAWSGQFQLTYTGSTLSHPFSKEVPNPGHATVTPLVTLSGTFSTRYRIDDKTTAGIGTGITTQTPFQGQKHTTLADPYADIARSFTFGPIHNRADFQYTQWTSNQYYAKDGYRQGITVADESFYETKFGLTIGLALQYDANNFAKGDQYPQSEQAMWDFAVDPYFEYALNETFNLRSVIGILDSHNKDNHNGKYQHPDVYQTFGVGIAATKAIFVYVFAQALPYSGHPVTSNNTTCGFSTIINLF